MAIKQLRDGSSRSLLAGASYRNSADTMHALSYGKRRKAMASLALLFVYSLLFSIFWTCTAQDTIEPSQAIRDGETLVSAGGTFELGFFSPPKLSTRYLGLWYRNVTPQTVIWVANREMPLSGASGAVNFTNQGFLVLVNGANRVVWTSNVSRTAKDPVAQLLDSGNLVVKDRNDDDPDNYLWQSFDYLCDTLLPGMKLGTNFVTGFERYLSSWKSAEDPAPGRSVHIDTHGYPQVVNKKGSRIQFRLGSWNGITWTGTPYLKPSSTFTVEFEFNEKEVFFKYAQNGSALTRYTVYSSGIIQCYTWYDQSRDWMVVATAEADECENYALCGAYGSCNIDSSPICSCLDGFIPKSPREWNSTDWSGGCVRGTQLDCDGGDEFLKLSGMKLPDTSSSWFNRSISLEECKGLCLSTCSCTAYANLDIRGTGCLLWYGELFDMRLLKDGGQDIYVRLASSEVDSIQKIRSSSQNQKDRIISGFVVLVLVFVMLVTGMFLYLHRKIIRKPASAMAKKSSLKNAYNRDRKENMEMPIFDLATIADATDNFSNSNRLGEGGFGPVYKGILEGHDVAVKRLSKRSGQGLNEFKNEAVLIAKLQHRNLVRLLGCCIHEDEKMLIYEYMPNRSLDFFIFDKTGRKLLDWHKCIHIIGGIARGLLYLHQDSRLRIIHRDVKASNILLDGNMNPKISDFGLARTFGADQTEANTNTVVGTYGYMSPEYAVDGLFSMKSDVFSFGVLVLEIVSGKKNRGFCHADHDLNLLGHAWMLWTRGTPMELIDESLVDSCTASEVIRCIHVALLCVQQRPEDRPTMSTVVLMLGSENPLTEPKQPGFFMGRCRPEANSSSSKNALSSPNEITITVLEPR